MCLICIIQKNISNKTILHCWHKVGILAVINVDKDFQSEAAEMIVLINGCKPKKQCWKISDWYKKFNNMCKLCAFVG